MDIKIIAFAAVAILMTSYGTLHYRNKANELDKQVTGLTKELVQVHELNNVIHTKNVKLSATLDEVSNNTFNFIKKNPEDCVFSSQYIKQLNSTIDGVNQ